MMKSLTRNETAEFLRTHDHYCILTHRRPDGDTVGSAAFLCRLLRAMGKTAHILRNEEVTPRLLRLHEGLIKGAAEPGDTIVTVDVAAPNMLPGEFENLLGNIALRIDHHGKATSFTDAELVDPGAAACAEILWDLSQILEVPMDQAMAQALYVAVSTDTGCFRFANTTEHTFQTAAACAAAGAEVFRLNQEFFETVSLAKLKLQSWIVDHMQFFAENKIALVALPRAVELDIGVTEDDMDNISNFPRTIAGVCLAAMLRETKDGTAKLSVRAVPGWDAAEIAASFGGGGHKGAAGANMNLPLEEAVQAVENCLKECETPCRAASPEAAGPSFR